PDIPVTIAHKPDAVALTPAMDGAAAFRDVVFGYDPQRPVLKDVSVRVTPGETVALVGPTGSGTTSAIAPLRRLYAVQGAPGLAGGHDVRDVTLASLGQQVAMVLQEPFLFTGTVFENIRYSKADATLYGVSAAARAVGAHDFIERL